MNIGLSAISLTVHDFLLEIPKDDENLWEILEDHEDLRGIHEDDEDLGGDPWKRRGPLGDP